ncbi:MAG: glycosyltransferase, partial [Patescibacteria group bacterium]
LRFTSPLKLFTYMASGVPIVTSDLPSIREVVDEKSAFLVPADNPDALAEGIMQALENTEDATRRAGAARVLLPGYTWAKRAERILAFLEAPSFAKASDGQADVIGYLS